MYRLHDGQLKYTLDNADVRVKVKTIIQSRDFDKHLIIVNLKSIPFLFVHVPPFNLPLPPTFFLALSLSFYFSKNTGWYIG